MSITVKNPNNKNQTYTYGKRGRKPFWVLDLENALHRLNKAGRKCTTPYNKPIDKEGPRIIEIQGSTILAFDGWTNVLFSYKHPDEPARKSRTLLENLTKRAMCIQRRLFKKRLCDYNSFIDLLGKGARDTVKNDEDGLTDAEERQSHRTNIVI